MNAHHQKKHDQSIDAEVRAAAEAAGVLDDDVPSAIELFTKAVRAGKTSDPHGFFAWLKTDRPELFGDPTMQRILKGVRSMPTTLAV